MKEETIVRENLMTIDGYSPYCGNNISRHEEGGCSNPRTILIGSQFKCSECGWVSQFPQEFIDKYMQKWHLSSLKK